MDKLALKTLQSLTRRPLDEDPELLEMTLHAADAGSWVWDFASGCFLWDRGYHLLLGTDPGTSEPSFDTWVQTIHTNDRMRVVDEMQAAISISARRDVDVEYRIVRPDGVERDVNTRGRTAYDREGRPVRMVGVTFDISARRRKDEQLRKSEEHARKRAEELTAVLEAAPAAILLAEDPECRVISGNRAAHEWSQVPMWSNFSKTAREGDAIPHFHMFRDGVEIPPDDLPLQRAARGDEEAGFELMFTCDDGALRNVFGNAVALRRPDGTPRGAVGVFIDISKRKEAEEALRSSEARYRALIEAAPVFVWHADAQGHVMYQSEDYHRYTGLPAERGTAGVPSSDCMAAIHPDDRPRVRERWQRSFTTHEPYEVELRLRGQDGVYRWYLDRGVPIHGAGGSVAGWVGSSTNIEDRKRVESVLVETARRKDEFLAMLAHELRNPLAPIRSAVHAMGRLDAEDPRFTQMRAIIERQTEQLARLVDDLLDIARINQGKVTLRKEVVELATVIERAVETSRPLIDARRHHLNVSLPAGPLPVDADVVRLTQVFLNLLNNSAKYTDEGGRIDVDAEISGGQIVVRVTDDGIGIPADLLPRIFDLFEQADRAIDRTQGGLGVGLTLAKHIVEMHGGTVTAASDGPGKGSMMTVRLPLSSPAEAGAHSAPLQAAPDSDAAPSSVRRRVLVVDDNLDSAETTATLLELGGHDVAQAHDGRSALEKAAEFHPQVVLLDLGLPGIDGYEVARRLRSQPDGERVVLMALTGYGHARDRQKAKEAGIDHHLTKPVKIEVLEALIDSLTMD